MSGVARKEISVKVDLIAWDSATFKEEIIEGIKEAVEEVKLYNKGELKLKSFYRIYHFISNL